VITVEPLVQLAQDEYAEQQQHAGLMLAVSFSDVEWGCPQSSAGVSLRCLYPRPVQHVHVRVDFCAYRYQFRNIGRN
jgi:hypothetical protein